MRQQQLYGFKDRKGIKRHRNQQGTCVLFLFFFTKIVNHYLVLRLGKTQYFQENLTTHMTDLFRAPKDGRGARWAAVA